MNLNISSESKSIWHFIGWIRIWQTSIPSPKHAWFVPDLKFSCKDQLPLVYSTSVFSCWAMTFPTHKKSFYHSVFVNVQCAFHNRCLFDTIVHRGVHGTSSEWIHIQCSTLHANAAFIFYSSKWMLVFISIINHSMQTLHYIAYWPC